MPEWQFYRARVGQICAAGMTGEATQKLPMACQYVLEGKSNPVAKRTTCRGQREILRSTPGLPAGAVRVAAPGIAGPCSALAAARRFYQLAACLAEATNHPYFPEILSIYSEILKRK